MVVPMRLAATMRLKLVGVGGADAAEAMCATSSCAVGTGRYAHTVGTRNAWAHVAAHHSSGVGYAEAPHVFALLSAEPVAAGHRARVPSLLRVSAGPAPFWPRVVDAVRDDHREVP